MRLTPCEGCGRHLYAVQTFCPFCGDTRADPIGGLLPWVIAGLLGTVGCAPSIAGDDGAQGGTSGSAGLETSSGSTTADPTTTPTPLTTSTAGSDDDAVATTDGSDGFDDAGDNPCGFYAGCSPDIGDDDFFECDLLAQDCPQGEKCMPWANDGGGVWNATRCSPIAIDPGTVGEACFVEGSATSGIDDCELGTMCFGVELATNAGQCVALCSGIWSDPTCDDGQVCSLVGVAPVALCGEQCNPLELPCADGDICTPAGDAFGCLPPSYAGDQGEPCLVSTACSPGNVCVDAKVFPECQESSCCTSLCDLSAPTCPGSLTCVAWYEDGEAPPGFDNLGACIVP